MITSSILREKRFIWLQWLMNSSTERFKMKDSSIKIISPERNSFLFLKKKSIRR